ncbi:MAG TPA: endonuclease III [Actinomycetota bacterium]|nr:endonuclease III [Actinomycetota bacterium]
MPSPRTDVPHRPRRGTPPSPATVREIRRRLARAFGPLDPPRTWDPIEELVLTVLSQNTSDANSGRAFEELRRRWPAWEALAAASPEEVADAIRSGGLANIKAPRILAILDEIAARQEGRIDLSWMRHASDEEVRDYLVSLPGVGPKTAACVLAFSLGRPALPVDTHVHRVAHRLGFFGDRVDAARAHDVMEELVPPALRVDLHVGMIRLGREICRAGRPRCEECPLNDLCPTAPREARSRRAGRRTGASSAR